MIAIESNVEEILEELLTASKKIADGNAAAVLRPDKYLAEMKAAARFVLESITTPEEKHLIQDLLHSILAYATTDSMAFEMTAQPVTGKLNISAGEISFESMTPLLDDITEWVRMYKEKTPEDIRKYPDDGKLAQHIIGAMKNDPDPWFDSENPEGLLAYLQTVNPTGLAQALGLTSLSDSRTSELITAVLQLWHDIMGVRVVAESLQQINESLGPNR